MKILIAEDDAVSRRILEVTLQKWGHEVQAVGDGQVALDFLDKDDAPPVAIMDWMMPNLDGPEVCRRLRRKARSPATYVILLTARSQPADVIAGLDSGADDFVTKPFERDELQARLRVAFRYAALQKALAERVAELEKALERVKNLQGLLPICSYCKSIRNDQNYWLRVEEYISNHADVQFSHGICPPCFEKHVMPQIRAHQIPRPESRGS